MLDTWVSSRAESGQICGYRVYVVRGVVWLWSMKPRIVFFKLLKYWRIFHTLKKIFLNMYIEHCCRPFVLLEPSNLRSSRNPLISMNGDDKRKSMVFTSHTGQHSSMPVQRAPSF